jgi:hypothetical protein
MRHAKPVHFSAEGAGGRSNRGWLTLPTLCAAVRLALTGIGMGLATGPLMAVAVGAVPPARSGTAAALINVARMAGATIGVAVLGATFALAQGGVGGLRLAMLIGGLAQITAAIVAWVTTPNAVRWG